MSRDSVKNRIIALLLSAVMVMPAAAFAADETDDGADPEVIPEIEMITDAPAEGEETPGEPDDAQQEEAVAGPADAQTPEPALLTGLSAEENPTGTVELRWDAFGGAAYYGTSSPQINDGEAVWSGECAQTFSGLDHGVIYDFAVAAYDSDGAVIAQGVVSIETVAYKINFDESGYRVLANRTIRPKKFSINLRKMINEPDNGYSVVQGGCTDGTYAYYLMVSSKTQKGRVLKVRISTNKVVRRSKVLKTWHGNGMAYDSKRKKLAVISRDHRKQEITLIDAKTLRITKQKNVKYSYRIDAGSEALNKRYKQSGLAAIAYVKKYDCYVTLERVNHNLLIFDPDTFECIGLAYTSFDKRYPGTFQAMDADEKYVYLLLSYYSRKQPYNLILAIDWNSENLLPVVNAGKSKDLPFVDHYWFCGNDLSGAPDAAIRIRTGHEAENIYHTKKNGSEHFYMAEYFGHYAYKKVGKKKKLYYKRDNYVYDLGII